MRPIISAFVVMAAAAYAAPNPCGFDRVLIYNPTPAVKIWQCSKQALLLDEDEDEESTIWNHLNNDPQFSKLVRKLKVHDDLVKMLDDSSASLTFFAPTNDALPDRDHDGGDSLSYFADELLAPRYGDDDDKEHRRQRIMRSIVQYHMLPLKLSYNELMTNSTVSTCLSGSPFDEDKSFDDQPRRIRVEYQTFPLPPTLQLNFYVRILTQDIKAKNGFIHSIDHVLMPPPSIMDVLFLLPNEFSTVTSSIQKVGLDQDLQYRYVPPRDDDHFRVPRGRFRGTPSLTFFVPTNEAWNKLPEKMKMYLFSPAGEKALRKLMEYHIVEDWIIHSEWMHQANSKGRSHPHTDYTETSNDFDITIKVPTWLEKHHLNLHIIKKSSILPWQAPSFTFVVNGQEHGGVVVQRNRMDGVAKNGAWHAIPEVLDPRGSKGPDSPDRWNDWEDWFPHWAEKA